MCDYFLPSNVLAMPGPVSFARPKNGSPGERMSEEFIFKAKTRKENKTTVMIMVNELSLSHGGEYSSVTFSQSSPCSIVTIIE